MLFKEKNYLNALTFPRFILAIMVVVFHYGQEAFPFGPEKYALTKFAQNGNIAVSFFFFLSGFILTYKYWNKKINIKTFYIKRIARIYPIYIITLLVLVVLALYYSTVNYDGTVHLIFHALGLQSWISGTELYFNSPAWSLSVEFFFYLLFPFLLLGLKKLKRSTKLILILGFYVFSVFQYYYFADYAWKPNADSWNSFLIYFPLWHLNTFLMGILGGLIFLRIENYKQRSWFWFFLALVSSLLFFYILASENTITRYAHNGALAPLFILLSVGLAKDERVLNKVLGWKPLVFLGEISYGIYLWQFIVYILFTQFTQFPSAYGRYFYVYTFILVLVGAISYIWIEKPARRWMISKWTNN
ncbi:MAG: acyltransferase family protein [Lishizhenia sp.]